MHNEIDDELDIEPHMFGLARCLIDYHRHSMSVRSQGLVTHATFDSPEIRELVNVMQWCGNGFHAIDAAQHVLALSTIIRRNGDDIKKLIAQVKQYGATERLAYEVNFAGAQLEAAYTLLGLLDNG